MPRISFVMPTKNRDKIIGKSIQSIIDQSFSDWELIIVDDHSDKNDQTKSVVEGFCDDRLKYFRMSEIWSGGIAEARNFGNQLAQAPIIAVADSDDLQFPDRAKITVEAFEKEGYDVFYAKYDILVQETGEIKERKTPIVPFDLEVLKKYDIIPHVSSAYRRELAYDFPYNSFFRVAEDYDFFTRLAKAGKSFYFYDEKVFRCVLHGKNTTGGKRFVGYEDLILSNRGWKDTERNQLLGEILEDEK